MKYSSISIIMALIISVFLLVGCGQPTGSVTQSPTGVKTSTTPPQSPGSPTSTSTKTLTATGTGITEWKSKILPSNMVFGPDVATTINGKDYLIYAVNFGTNPDGPGTNSDVGIIILDITTPDNPNEIAYLKNGTNDPNQFIQSLQLDGPTLYS